MQKLSLSFNSHNSSSGGSIIFETGDCSKSSIQLKNSQDLNVEENRKHFANIDNESICVNVEGDILLENLSGTTIKLIGSINSLRIKNTIDSNISLSDICSGSIFIENVKGGKLTIVGDQIRIHDTSDVDIFLFSKSSCILEECKDLRFYPNRSAAKLLGYSDEEEGYWKCVQDFGFNPESSFKLVDLSDDNL